MHTLSWIMKKWLNLNSGAFSEVKYNQANNIYSKEVKNRRVILVTPQVWEMEVYFMASLHYNCAKFQVLV